MTGPDSPAAAVTVAAVKPYKAAWNRVHMAVVRAGLWSPCCSDEVGWVAPLADPDLAGQITCKVCHPLAMTRNARLNATQESPMSEAESAGDEHV